MTELSQLQSIVGILGRVLADAMVSGEEMREARDAEVARLQRRAARLQRELGEALQEAEQASEAQEAAEAGKAEQHANIAYLAAELDRHVGIAASLHDYAWLNDDRRPVHCRTCGRGWPLHQHDCPLGTVE